MCVIRVVYCFVIFIWWCVTSQGFREVSSEVPTQTGSSLPHNKHISRHQSTTLHGHDSRTDFTEVDTTSTVQEETSSKAFIEKKNPHFETTLSETTKVFHHNRTPSWVTTDEKNKDVSHYEKSKGVIDKTVLKKVLLHSINGYRMLHGAHPLKLNKTISKYSQKRADKILTTGKLIDSDTDEYGESSAYFPNDTRRDGYAVAEQWYLKVRDYKFGGEPRNSEISDFTQMVWKGTSEVGIGVAESNDELFVVVNYYPPGNIRGKYTTNVLPALKEKDLDVCLLPKVKGYCKAYSPRFYYDALLGKCLKFIYGGCMGTYNRFHELKECEEKCVKRDDKQTPHVRVTHDVDICKLPKVEGPCSESYLRYYYDTAFKKCREFIYGGCKGNENNFKTKHDCEYSCLKRDEAIKTKNF